MLTLRQGQEAVAMNFECDCNPRYTYNLGNGYDSKGGFYVPARNDGLQLYA